MTLLTCVAAGRFANRTAKIDRPPNELEPRGPIPSEPQMIRKYGIGRKTARHVADLLREQGRVFTLARRET
uniref:hypothetical protein n=1 Tax=Nonomuraea bangladeshensis TaxID=404385 RepID=UPI003F4924CD